MPTTTPDPVTQSIATSAESMAAMEAEIGELLAAQQAPQPAAPTPAAPAIKPAATPKPPATESTPTAKVAGAPTPPKPAEPATTPATPPSGAPDFSDIPAEYTPGKTRAPQWDRLRAKADHWEGQATTLAKELATLRAQASQSPATAATPAEVTQRLTTLQQERDTLQARLEAVAVERSPRFEAQFKPRQEAAILAAKEAVGPALAPQVEELLKMDPSTFRNTQISAIAETLPIMERDELLASARELNRIHLERRQLATRSNDLYKSWTAEEAAAREQQASTHRQQATTVFDTELRDWQPLGLSVDEITSARNVYSGSNTTLVDAARAAMWAVAGPKLAHTAQAAQARVTELEAELGRLRAVQPGTARDTGGSAPTADADDPATMSFSERVAKMALSEGVFRGGR